MKLKKLYRALSVTLSLTLCVSLAMPAFADNKPTDDQQKVLDETVYVYLNVGEDTVTDEQAPSMPTFTEPDSTAKDAVDKAKGELDVAEKPSEFVPETSLDDGAVGTAPEFDGDFDGADKAITDKTTELNNEKDALEAQKSNEESELNQALKKAQDDVNAANSAIKDATDKKDELDKNLEKALGGLTALEPKDEDKPGELESYESYEAYKAAVDAYNEKVSAYNTARSELEKDYNAAIEALNEKVTAATSAKEAAETAVNDATEALKTFNDSVADYNDKATQAPDEVGEYNDKVDEYNDKVDEYNDKVDEYNGKVGEYNDEVNKYNESDAVKGYNDKVDAYNTAKDKYDEEFDKYKADVEAYDKEALEWNTDKAGKNDDAAIDALLKDADGNAVSSLLDSTYAQEALQTAEGQEITINKGLFNAVNSGEKTAADLTEEQIAEYNAAVKAYNTAVDNYNNSVKDDLFNLLKTDDRFEGQNGNKWDTDTNANLWFTIGKVDVGNVFGDATPSDTKRDHANTGTDYSSETSKRDVYYWDKGEDGQWTGSAANSQKPLNETAADNLTEELGDLGNLKHYQGGKEEKVDLSDVTTKWVLKVSDGANGYDETGVSHCYHLDGYLKVTKLAKLAELAPVPTNEYKDAVRISAEQAETKGTLDDSAKKTGLEWTAPGSVAAKDEWNVTAPVFEEITLDELAIPTADLPTITPTATPEPTPVPTATPEPTPVPTATPEPTPVPTATPEPTPVPTVEPTVQPSEVIVDEPDVPLVDTPEEVTIDEPEVPLVETPEEVEIDEPEVPLDEIPEEIEIDEPEVPLDEMPEEIEIDEEEIPLADVPQTGDISILWYAVALFSVAGLMAVNSLERKQRKEDLKTALRRSFWR